MLDRVSAKFKPGFRCEKGRAEALVYKIIYSGFAGAGVFSRN
jgi:hypothetical protein